MLLGRDYVTSRFGKRTFALLIALVIAPVTVVAFVAIWHLDYELRQNAQIRLHRNAKEYGLALLQRLTLIKREISYPRAKVGEVPRFGAPFRVSSRDPRSLLARVRGTASATGGAPILPLVLAERAPGGATRVYMIMSRVSAPLALEIDPHYLWGPPGQLPLAHLCVTGAGVVPLYCSTPTARALLEASRPRAGSHTVFDSDVGARRYLGYAWDLFLQGDFQSPVWRVYAFESEQDVLAPADSFKHVFIPAIIALIAATLLLGVIQIRRRLEPLNQLVTGTRRLARREFNTRVDIHSGDEFEDLASAFNSMAQRLGTQIGTLETLSSVDKTILKTLDVQIVSAQVLKGLSELTPAAWAAVGAVDRDSPGQGRVCFILRNADDVETRRVKMEFGDLDWRGHRRGVEMALTEPGLSFLEPVRTCKTRSCFAVPFFSDDQLDGILCLGFTDAVELDDEMYKTMEDFADRLAVAAAADKKEKLLQRQANFDSLTGLPNRFLLKDRLDRALIHARGEGRGIAVLFLDLDRFKVVNDTLGHSKGDLLLVEAASRLMSCMNRSDTLARLGGDEFVILISEFESIGNVVHTANRIIRSFSEPFTVNHRELLVGTSMGIALFPQDGADSEELLRNADTAMYATKARGRGSYYFYDQSMNQALQERARVETDLWRAVRDHEFELWYQPQLDLLDGCVSGAEALLRWRHPERGIVGPDQFVPLAEELGLIDVIGSQALEMACRQYAAWRAEGLVLDRIAVNVSPREFRQEDYVTRVHDILKRFGMPPLRLTLEITENLLVHDTERVMAQLLELKDAGVSFSIDDFGIGYSSLAYLQKLPIDTLKIDGSFIRDITSNHESAAIVAAILDMATRLNIGVIAEGVETDAQLTFLRDCGCAQIQGYIYSRPLHPDELFAFAKTRAGNWQHAQPHTPAHR